ncbi:sensor histidine kinase [Rhodanobacter ginsengiterrae]|uniref:sensor histidine kinase n=1 Tax=Rhodanobacter ginsengiterrae TaxID=2008451 RepID=UPI003CFA012C
MLVHHPAPAGINVISGLLFLLRIALAWFLLIVLVALAWSTIPWLGAYDWPVTAAGILLMAWVVAGAFSHLARVRLLAGHLDHGALANRQRRQIEIPLDAGDAFDLLEAAVRELPRIEQVESARGSLMIRATLGPNGEHSPGRWNPLAWLGMPCNQLQATVAAGHDRCSATLICEPAAPAWSYWFLLDGGSNFEHAETVTRAVSEQVAARRRTEKAAAAQTETEKQLTVAKLRLLHAQVEPHFLYNTLASAQLLARNDPPRADEMLGHLIHYLRHSLPRADDQISTLDVELDRAVAYLEILKIRMGQRLTVQVDVAEALRATALPPMMLQTLVENAIKHGLEPRIGGGTLWIRARRSGDAVALTVADDGVGFTVGGSTSDTGIGLNNVRERLRLVYGTHAALAVVANFPAGVAATISVPAGFAREGQHG